MNREVRVLLSIDVLSGNQILIQNLAKFFSNIKAKVGNRLHVQPIYVDIEVENKGFLRKYSFPSKDVRIREEGKKLQEMCANISFESGMKCASPIELHSKGNSYEKMVDEVIEFSQGYKPHIVVSLNQPKSVISRLVLGNYTEELVDRSLSPVLVIGSKTHFSDFNRLLFCSIYRGGDSAALKCSYDLAERLSIGVTVYNNLPSPYDSLVMNNSFLGGESYLNLSREQRKISQMHAEDLIHDAKFESAKADISIKIEDETIPVDEAVLGRALADRMMVVLTVGTQNTFWDSIGSVWRAVVKNAPVPVLLIGPLTVEYFRHLDQQEVEVA